MMGDAYATGLPVALERGLVDDGRRSTPRCAACCALKERLGLFDDPYRRRPAAPGLVARAPRRRTARSPREAARRSLVLLTNRGGLLPLARPARAASPSSGRSRTPADDMLGPWSAAGAAAGQVSLLDGLRAAFPAQRIAHAPGVAIDGDDASGIAGGARRGARRRPGDPLPRRGARG